MARKKKNEPEGILVYRQAMEALLKMPAEQAGNAFRAAAAYALRSETDEELDLAEQIVFGLLKDGIDRCREKYEQTCERNGKIAAEREKARRERRVETTGDETVESAENGHESSPTKQKKTKQNKTKQNKTEQNKTEDNSDSSSDKPTARGARFTPPTVDEVRKYCEERGNGVDASRFVDFYSAKGWMVGKNKMRDWKSAVRTWEHDDGGGGYGARNGGFDRNGWPKPLGPLYTDEDYDRAEEEWEAWQAQQR